MAAAAAAAATTTTTSASSSKLADSTDASTERYSPSSSCNGPEDFDPATSRLVNNNNENDCDMPTDLTVKVEKS